MIVDSLIHRLHYGNEDDKADNDVGIRSINHLETSCCCCFIFD